MFVRKVYILVASLSAIIFAELKTISPVFSLLITALCAATYSQVKDLAHIILEYYLGKDNEWLNLASHIFAILIYGVFTSHLIYSSLITVKDYWFPPAQPPINECEDLSYYQKAEADGQSGLILYIKKCSNEPGPFYSQARDELQELKYSKVKQCFLLKKCQENLCLQGPEYLPSYQQDQLSREADDRMRDASCSPFAPKQEQKETRKNHIDKVDKDSSAPAENKSLAWEKLGFNKTTADSLPVYMYPGTQHERDGQIADALKALLLGKLHFTDLQHAALTIEVDDASTFYDDSTGPKGYVTFQVALKWIDGTPLRPLIDIEANTDKYEGSPRDEALQLSAMRLGVNQACAKILSIIGDSCS